MTTTALPTSLPREEALQRLPLLLDGAGRGVPALVVVHGPHGSGRTHLAARFSAEALRRGFRVAELDAARSRRAFYATDRLTRQLGVRTDAAADDLTRLHRLRLACQRGGAGRSGVVLIIDNADLLATEDAEALHDLLVAPPLPSFCGVLTVSDTPAGRRAAEALAGTFGAARLRVESIDLGPLTDDEVAALAEERLTAGLMTYRFVRDLRALGNGLASHIVRILEAVERLPAADRAHVMTGSEVIDEAITPGPLVDDLVRPLIDLPEPGLRIARALAVLRIPATVDGVAEVAGIGEPSATAALADLEDAGIVASELAPRGEVVVSFRVPLLGVAVRCATPLPLRRTLSDRAAAMFERRPIASGSTGEDALVAQYLEGDLPLTAARADRVVAAAQQFVARSRYAAARRVLEATIARASAGAPDPLPPRAFTVLSEALSRSGAAHEASRVLDVAAAAEQPVGSAAEAMIRQARTAVALGRERIARSVLEAGLRRDDLDDPTRAMLRLELGRLLMMTRDPEQGRALVNEAFEIAAAIPDYRLTADIDMAQHVSYLYAGQAQRALVHSRRALISARHADVPPATRARALTAVGNALLDTGTLDRGLHWLRRANRDAEVAEDLPNVAWTSQVLSEGCIEHGLWDEAVRWAARAVRLDTSLHRDQSLRHSQAIDARLRALRGMLDAEWADESTFPRTVDWAEGPPTTVSVCMAHVEHALLAGRARQAQALLRDTLAQLRGPLGRGRGVLVDLLPASLDTARALHDAEAAREAADELADLAESTQNEMPVARPLRRLARATVAALEEDWGAVTSAAAGAGAELAALGFHYRAATAFALAGEAHVHLLEPQAEDFLTRAFRMYRAAGAQPRLAGTRELLHEIGSRAPRSRASSRILTARQWEIARLAAEGRTDAAIAASLAISRRTVTTHMHHVLGRLDLASRQQLGEWFREHPES